MTLRFESTNLIFRTFEEKDLLPFFRYRSDPQVALYQGWDVPYSFEVAREFVAQMSAAEPGIPGEWYQLALEPKAGGEIIGDAAFKRLKADPRQAEIGLTLSRERQKQGYGLEATLRLLAYLFDDLGLHRVMATCDVENIPAARTLAQAGLRREAHFIEHLWYKGRWSSEFVYAMLNREWQEIKTPK
ncbi:MAG TPA: GNAT family protein [Anaerolineaceae bacterium]|nr:GNAT family protein [Anaerolineaceae bacterium]HPN50923.1 GNAT family protein [Anaerolineaceae bacterium]